MVELKDKSEEIKRNNRLLAERNIQIHSLEKDLAIKEEAIQKLRVELEESQLSADQVAMIHYNHACIVISLKINTLCSMYKARQLKIIY